MLSVIVPIYNVEKYLARCINSIIHQKYKNIEILLIDDGSMDQSCQICDDFAEKDNRIIVVHQSNKGLVCARKAGLMKAKGEYITFVDGDDWIEPDMYLELIDILEKSKADIVDSGFFYNVNDNLVLEKRLRKNVYQLDDKNRHNIFLTLIGLNDSNRIVPNIWSKIFRANIIKESYENVPDSMQYGEDVISFLYCILKSQKLIQTGDIFYHYNYRQDSLSHFKSLSFVKRELKLWEYCGDIILKNDDRMTQNKIDTLLFHKLYDAFSVLMNQEFDVIQYYSFPYIKKLFYKKIVIYGAGRVGKDYLTQISKYEKCQIVGWIDSKYKDYNFKYRDVQGIEDLEKITYDIILIAVEKKTIADEIKCFLLRNEVPEIKILWSKPDVAF